MTMTGCSCPHCGKYIRDYHPVSNPDICSCSKCDYQWEPRGEKPLRCPNCGSYRWNENTFEASCIKCGHSWSPRSGRFPERCPQCKTRAWHTSEMPEIVPVKKPLEENPRTGIIREICIKYDKGMGCREISEVVDQPLMYVLISVRENLGIFKPKL